MRALSYALPFVLLALAPACSSPPSIDGQLWYRVYVGPYGNQEAAQEAEASVKEHRLSTWTMIVRIR